MTGLSSKKLAIALVASLALNLFLGGVWTAQWLGHRFEMHQRGGPPHHLRRGMDALGDEARQTVRQVFDRHAPALRQSFRAHRDARQAIRAVFEEDDFDRARAETALASLGAQRAAMRDRSNALMLEIAESLPPEDRRVFFRHVRPPDLMRRLRRHEGPPPGAGALPE